MFTCAGFLCHKRKFLAPIGADTKYSGEREQTLKKAKDFALQNKKHQFKLYPKLVNLADNYRKCNKGMQFDI